MKNTLRFRPITALHLLWSAFCIVGGSYGIVYLAELDILWITMTLPIWFFAIIGVLGVSNTGIEYVAKQLSKKRSTVK